MRIRLADAEPSPDVFAAVMATGILSIAAAMATDLSPRSPITVSLVFFWDALAAWLIVVGAGLLHGWRALARKAGT